MFKSLKNNNTHFTPHIVEQIKKKNIGEVFDTAFILDCVFSHIVSDLNVPCRINRIGFFGDFGLVFQSAM